MTHQVVDEDYKPMSWKCLSVFPSWQRLHQSSARPRKQLAFFTLVIWRQSSYTYVCKGGQWVGWGCVVSRWRNQGGEYGAAYVKAVVGVLSRITGEKEGGGRGGEANAVTSQMSHSAGTWHMKRWPQNKPNPAVLFPLKHFLVLHLNKDTLLNNSGLYSSTQYCIDPPSSHPRHRKLKDIYSWTVQKMCRGFKMALHQKKKSSGFQFEGKL